MADEPQHMDLFHKRPQIFEIEDDGPPILTANPAFDLKDLLLNALRDEDMPEYLDAHLIPLPAPSTDSHTTSPTPSSSEPLLNKDTDLFSLSPLSSPGSTPPSSPSSKKTPLPGGEDMQRVNIILSEILVDVGQANSSHPAHKQSRRAKNHQNRREKRERQRQSSFSHHETRPNVQKDHVASSQPIPVSMATENCATTKAAFTGLNDRLGKKTGGRKGKSGKKRRYTLPELVGEDSQLHFGYVCWDGRTRKHVSDARGRKIAFLAGQPREEEWPALMQQAAEALETRRPCLSIPSDERVHRRGAFPAIRCGVSHGNGSTEPINLQNNTSNAAVVDELIKLECFKRLAGFSTSVMASQAPKLYNHYVDRLGKLHANHPHLKRLFPSSVFAAASFNFGPQTVCFRHKDFANLPFGLCSITALGSFDPSKGGHLILWNCHLVIEFPPGSTILLPSAIIEHSNVPVQSNETRYSFAQYTAGGLFRWVAHGCKLEEDFYASLSPEELENEKRKDAERWEFGLSLFEKSV